MFFLPLPFVALAAAAVLALGWDASRRAIHPGQTSYAWSLADYPELSSEDVRISSSTGTELVGRLFPGHTRATIILLHGYGGHQDEMLPVANTLHRAGFSVFTYDQRGSGQSDGDVTFGAREQDDLVSVVDYLTSRPDVADDKLGAMGFSMGGGTLLLTAAREPRIKAIVADSAWADVRHWLRPSLGAVFTRPRDRFTALSLKLAERQTNIDLGRLRPADVVGRISPRPVLLVHGADDTLVRADEARENFEAAQEPKELVIVDGARHGDTIAPGGISTEDRIGKFFDNALHANKVAA